MLQAVSGRGGAAGRGDTRSGWWDGRGDSNGGMRGAWRQTASASNSQRSADGVQRASGS